MIFEGLGVQMTLRHSASLESHGKEKVEIEKELP